MPPRPLFGQNPAKPVMPGVASVDSSHEGTSVLPLASQLPAWDLQPAHELLTRRRPATSKQPVPQQPAAVDPLAVPAAPVNDSPPMAPAAAPSCRSCKAPLEEGSSFCTECGARQG